MSFTLTMPKLSPTMEAGAIAKWHKKPGDFVEAGELLIEVATDKATVEFNAIDSGFLRQILVKEGQEAEVNQPIAYFTETKDEALKTDAPQGSPKQSNDQIKPVGEEEPKQSKETKQPHPEPSQLKSSGDPLEYRLKASPLARKLASDQKLDISQIKGTGPGGRIVSRDLASQKGEVSNEVKPSVASETFSKVADAKPTYEEPLSMIRKVIAKRLQEAKNNIPHFYVTLEIDAEPLIAIREQLSHLEHKVSFNDLIVKGSALALAQHPEINSGFNEKNQTLIRFGAVDISIAVSVESGLITPIVTNTNEKSIENISDEIRALSKKAKEGKLQPAEFQGGSFTVSNLGMFGVSEFQAIINPPQAAILAVSGILDKPVVKGNQVVPGKTLNLTLSVDHRVIDGVAAAKFLKTLQFLLENPVSLIS